MGQRSLSPCCRVSGCCILSEVASVRLPRRRLLYTHDLWIDDITTSRLNERSKLGVGLERLHDIVVSSDCMLRPVLDIDTCTVSHRNVIVRKPTFDRLKDLLLRPIFRGSILLSQRCSERLRFVPPVCV